MGINNACVVFVVRRQRGYVEAIHTPDRDLTIGRHKVEVFAENRIGGQSFTDEFCWEFDLF